MRKNLGELVGKKFNRWTVLKFIGRRSHEQLFECECACGAVRSVTRYAFVGGYSKSCGCWNREVSKSNAALGITCAVRKHGMARSREHIAWLNAKSRCLNPRRAKDYKEYGGRGITFHTGWINSFERFFADMGSCPSGMTLGRKDNDKGYSPENCEWQTWEQQQNNTQRTVWVETNIGRMSLRQAADAMGIGQKGYNLANFYRHNHGITPLEALRLATIPRLPVFAFLSPEVPPTPPSAK